MSDLTPSLHAVCWATVANLRAEFAEALDRQRRELGVDHQIACRVRWLTLPGVKRRTIRLDELRDLIRDLEAAAGVGEHS